MVSTQLKTEPTWTIRDLEARQWIALSSDGKEIQLHLGGGGAISIKLDAIDAFGFATNARVWFDGEFRKYFKDSCYRVHEEKG